VRFGPLSFKGICAFKCCSQIGGDYLEFIPKLHLKCTLYNLSSHHKSLITIGTSTWDVYGDYLCSNELDQLIPLNLNGAPNMFNCKSGDAVDMWQRCNGMCDCPDCSDEDNCVVLDRLVNYNPRLLMDASGGMAEVVISTVAGLQERIENENERFLPFCNKLQTLLAIIYAHIREIFRQVKIMMSSAY
jgi:hypothetical protein